MSRPWLAPLVAGAATAAVVFALVAIASTADDGAGDAASRVAAAPAMPGGPRSAGRSDTSRAGFSAMPNNFAARMSTAELNALVDFLLASRRAER